MSVFDSKDQESAQNRHEFPKNSEQPALISEQDNLTQAQKVDPQIENSGGDLSALQQATQKGNSPEKLHSLRFRIFKRRGWKRSLRLEEIFWHSLEYLATRRGQKLTDYLRSQLEKRPDLENQSSFLRSVAACGIMAELEETQKQLARFGSRGILQAVPSPGFIVAEGLGLAGYNTEFLTLVRKLAAPGNNERNPQARLNFDLPVSGIKSALEERAPQPVDCGFSMTVGSRRCRGRVRVCLIPGPAKRQDLMGFIVSLQHDQSAITTQAK